MLKESADSTQEMWMPFCVQLPGRRDRNRERQMSVKTDLTVREREAGSGLDRLPAFLVRVNVYNFGSVSMCRSPEPSGVCCS